MPVVAMSWHEAASYCEWLSGMTGKRYRLPTEAEWERAARGGQESFLYPWGDAPPETIPDYDKRWKLGPEPVGLYKPNGYGLYNVGDNVHEWCSDWHADGYYARSPERNPEGPKSCPNHHRSSGTALYFLSRHCHQRRPAERETEIRTFRGSEHRSFAFTQFRGRSRNRASAEFAGRLWPGNGWIRKTFRHFDGYSGINEFFRNVCDFVCVAPRPALLRDAARTL